MAMNSIRISKMYTETATKIKTDIHNTVIDMVIYWLCQTYTDALVNSMDFANVNRIFFWLNMVFSFVRSNFTKVYNVHCTHCICEVFFKYYWRLSNVHLVSVLMYSIIIIMLEFRFSQKIFHLPQIVYKNMWIKCKAFWLFWGDFRCFDSLHSIQLIKHYTHRPRINWHDQHLLKHRKIT